MKLLRVLQFTILGFVLLHPGIASSEELQGAIETSPEYGSGRIELSPSVDFKEGDRLKLTIGGTARKVIIRLLPEGSDPNRAIGIIAGKAFEVPENRVVAVLLKENHRKVIQISVHGGPNPWGLFPLGHANGPATLLSAERLAE